MKIDIETNSGIPFSKYQTKNRRRKGWGGGFSASVQSNGSLEGTQESTWPWREAKGAGLGSGC